LCCIFKYSKKIGERREGDKDIKWIKGKKVGDE
jgi:hypothetical protein